jgi:serine protease Do
MTATRNAARNGLAQPLHPRRDDHMRKRPACWFSCLLPVLSTFALLSAPSLASTCGASELRHTATVRIVQAARPSIVSIHGQKTLTPHDEGYHTGEGPQRVNGMGTGIVIDERGYIVTNHHVVDGVAKIQVTLANKDNYVATLLSHDPKTDLAVIKIDAPDKLPVISIGTSSDLMIGEPVVAVGNAYGYENTVTRGIVSALHRTVQVSDAQSYQDLIQTDASINPGNSGGPLLNIDGDVIGINVAVRAGAQGIGFAIPIDIAMDVAAQLLSGERVGSVTHGVVPGPPADPTKPQLVVGALAKNSPAAKAGLQPGDVITAVGKQPVVRQLDLERAVLGRTAGDEVELTVQREGEPITISLALAPAARSKSSVADRAWDTVGLRLEPIAARQIRQTNSRYRGGLLVTSVRNDGPAAKAGIRRGDILVGMHEWETISLENISYILNRVNTAKLDSLKFFIVRDNETRVGYLPVSFEWK